jgi:tRNA nucleotidyltransferase (CCA-adding enzyme)
MEKMITPPRTYEPMSHRSKLEEDVLAEVRPSAKAQRAIEKAVASLDAALRREIERERLKAETILVGSIAKGTHLLDPDIDLFILFPPETPRADMEAAGLRLARAVMHGEERYAEHPYLHGTHEGLEVDIVPSYKVGSPDAKMTAVDRTPFHTAFVKGRITESQRDEVRLLKRFMKGVGVYGAEARFQGFSGYLAELLVLKYGSFRGVLEAAKAWQHGERIVLTEKKDSAFSEPLVVIDPVDAGRNVASAVSEQRMGQLIQAAHDYLAKPARKFFFANPRKPLSHEDLRELAKKRGTYMMALIFPAPHLTEDVLWPQARKCERRIASILEQYDFTVIDHELFIDGDVGIVLELASGSLPPVLRHGGPPAANENSQDFVAKWRASRGTISPPFLHEGRWYVEIQRKYREPVKLLASVLSSLDLGKNLNGPIRKDGKVLDHAQLLGGGHGSLLSALLDKRLPWEI